MSFLIVRPQGKAQASAATFIQAGLPAVGLPIIDIEYLQREFCIEEVAQTNFIVLTSTYCVNWLAQQSAIQNVLSSNNLQFVCVGKQTAEALTSLYSQVTIHIAEPESSEGVLALDCLQSQSAKVLIVKGIGGRNLIETELNARGLQVKVLEVYKRSPNTQAIDAFAFEQHAIQCIIATSVELCELLLANFAFNNIKSLTWIVASQRIRDYALSMGIENIVISAGASDNALLQCAQKIQQQEW